jgi:hypothetical protein
MPDNELSVINRLFVAALMALAQAGEADSACRLAARGWSALRHTNHREAERLNAAMHALARHPSSHSLKETGVANV